MTEDDYIKQIEQYKRGEMPESERLAFEDELKENTALRQLKEKYEMAHEAVDLLSEQAMQEQFQAWRKEKKDTVANPLKVVVNNSNKEGKTRIKKSYWRQNLGRLAAAIVLIVISTSIFFMINTTPAHVKMANAYVQTLDVNHLKSADTGVLNEAVKNYEREDYTMVIELIKTQKSLTDKELYILAHAYFKKENYEAAEDIFDNLENLTNTSFKEEGEWGVLMSMLAQNKTDQNFKNLLQEIADNSNHSFSTKAKDLANALKD